MNRFQRSRGKSPRHLPPRNTDKFPAWAETATLYLKAAREKSVLRGHPWVFSGAVDHVEGEITNGDTIAICNSDGGFLAWGGYSAHSQISARIWSWRTDEPVNADLLRRKIGQALEFRQSLGVAQHSNGMRLIHGEADGLPGLIVDQYGSVLVIQFGTAAAERWCDVCVDVLQEYCRPACIFERSESDVRALEGLPERSGLLRGTLPDEVTIIEHGLKFAIDAVHGQKTGFYLDQRDNRAVTGHFGTGKDVLNCFCYTGGFSLYALRGGAKSVLSIDASAEALEIAQHNMKLNELDESRTEWMCADVFVALRKLRDQGRSFDLIILDPPKFAPTAAFAEKAARGYKDINLLGFKLLRPGGMLFTYSCSGGIGEELFQKIIAGAAIDAGVDARIVQKLHAAPDHPVLLSFPESAYLKGLVMKIGSK